MNSSEESTPWHVPGKWEVSRYNWAEEVRKAMPFLPKKVEIRDVTCREADDHMGFYLSTEDKVKVALKAAEIGIPEIEIGGPNILPHQYKDCQAIRKAFDDAGVKTRITGRYFGVAKDHKREIDVCMEAGATNVRCTIMAGTIVGDKELDEELERLPEAVEYIHKEYDAQIHLGIDDATRSKMDRIKKVYEFVAGIGADKAWFADTHGVTTPSGIRYVASEIKKIIGDMPLQCHVHNHSGLGTATTLGAIEGGVSEPDVTWNGYGDCSGNTCLEEVVGDLEILYGIDTGIKLEGLYEVSQMVEKLSGVWLQPHKPYVGKNSYVFMSYSWSTPIGMMLAGVPKDEIEEKMAARKALLTEPLPVNPRVFNREAQYVWGAYGTRQEKVLKAKLELMGLKYTAEDIKKVQNALDAAVNEESTVKIKKGYLTEAEFEKLVRQTLSP